MNFSIAHLTDKELVNITSYSPNAPATQQECALDQLSDKSFHAVIISQQDDQLPAISTWIEENRSRVPIDSGSIFTGPIDKLANMEYTQARELLSGLQGGWVVSNNIEQIRTIFDTTDSLQKLWDIIHKNMATTALTIIYHDLVPKEEKKRDKLQLISATGEMRPTISQTDQWGTLLMENYSKSFEQHFFITEYNRERGEMVICASIDRSPVVIMLKSDQITPLSKAVIETVFTGMQSVED